MFLKIRKKFIFTLTILQELWEERQKTIAMYSPKQDKQPWTSLQINQTINQSFRRAAVHSLVLHKRFHQELACALSAALSGASSTSFP